VSYRDTESKNPDLTAVDEVASSYEGDALTVLSSANVLYDDATALKVNYRFVRTDNTQDNDDGLPLASDYDMHSVMVAVSHQIDESLSGKLAYSFDFYRDDHYADGVNDYEVHGIFASVTKIF